MYSINIELCHIHYGACCVTRPGRGSRNPHSYGSLHLTLSIYLRRRFRVHVHYTRPWR